MKFAGDYALWASLPLKYARRSGYSRKKSGLNFSTPPVCINFALCAKLKKIQALSKPKAVLFKNMARNVLKIILPFVLGFGILWWMYRDINLDEFADYVFHRMNWGWMALSLVFGVLAQQIRAWRWKMVLEPLGEKPRRRVCEDAIFLSYASSLVVPRIGEVTRCGTLKKYDKVPFSKALGTVVTERIVDSLVIMVLTAAIFLAQLTDFLSFLKKTGAGFGSSFAKYTDTGYIVTALCGIGVVALAAFLMAKFKAFSKGKDVIKNVWAGITSLRHISRLPLYAAYSLGIWLCYFLHFYIAFFCFDFTSCINPLQAFLIFCMGTFAVLVPTPNGAGPWHFVVKTLLVLYGVEEHQALMFAFVIHTIQTFEVVLLGAFGWIDLSLKKVATRSTGSPQSTPAESGKQTTIENR